MKMMSEKNIAASIVAFYLAKYNRVALEHLNFSSFSDAFSKCADMLGVKMNYIKLRRDEFDPIYNWRKGWDNRPMIPSVCRIVELFDQLPEPALRTFVVNMLSNRQSQNWDLLVDRLQDTQVDSSYAARIRTGKRAESYFREYHASTSLPVPGILEDCTEKGCGYDFLIVNGTDKVCVEVKGLLGGMGGIIFTDKEWAAVMEYGERYYLCIVRELDANPTIQFIGNPYKALNPIENIRTAIQITYSISHGELLKHK